MREQLIRLNILTVDVILTYDFAISNPVFEERAIHIPQPRYFIDRWKWDGPMNLYRSSIYYNKMRIQRIAISDEFWSCAGKPDRLYAIDRLIVGTVNEHRKKMQRLIEKAARMEKDADRLQEKLGILAEKAGLKNVCPKCNGKTQSLGAGDRFCLDCDWDNLAQLEGI